MPDQPPQLSRLAQELVASLRRVPLREPARMRKRPTRELGAIVEELRVKYQVGRPSPEEAIREQWAELVGSANATYSHPVRIDLGRRLVVHATHSVVRNELFLHRAAIVERVQRLPGCAGVRELHLRAG